MTTSRQVYFNDLLNDCIDAVIAADIPLADQPVVIAALVQSDSLNGLRKALLQNASAPGVAALQNRGDV